MTFTTYLSAQLVDFVEVYKKYFKKTYSTCIVLAICLLVCIALFVRFGSEGSSIHYKQFSILGYFLLRFSEGSNYDLVDLSKLIFIFMVSIFSISISRFENSDLDSAEKKSITGNISSADIAPLIFILVLTSGIDYGLTKIYGIYELKLSAFSVWACGIILQMRIYIPFFLFSIMIYQLRMERYPKITFKKIFFLFVTLWLFNEFTIEMAQFVRAQIFRFILIPYGNANTYIEESLLALPLIAFWFLGFHSAMNSSLRLLDEPSKTGNPEEDEVEETEKEMEEDGGTFQVDEPQ